MDKIKIQILNPEVAAESEKMMVCAARLTQRGHKIKSMADFLDLYNKEYTPETVASMANLPHPTIQKFGTINVVVVGASRRFLAQITRHQNEVKFMSASLQYSDYSGESDFVIPYEFLKKGEPVIRDYIAVQNQAMKNYSNAVEAGIDNDSAGYLAPQGLRNVLIISATPYQWKHMINQRVCRRNTDETRYIMLRIWEALYELSSGLFTCGPFCMNGDCKEGKMCCGRPCRANMAPAEIIEEDFPLLVKRGAR